LPAAAGHTKVTAPVPERTPRPRRRPLEQSVAEVAPQPEMPAPARPEDPAQPDPKPASVPSVTPVPETSVTPDEMPKPTPEELAKLGLAMKKAREAIDEHEFDRADAFLSVAAEMPRLLEHQAMLGRLKVLLDSARTYREAIQESISKLQAGSSFDVGATKVGVVETGRNKVIFRVNGTNRTYTIRDLPVGLAAALAAQTLSDADPNTLTLKGAYVLATPRASPDELEKAREFLTQASGSSDAAKEILTLLDDKYDLAAPPRSAN
jgi:hypothetical protein